MKPVCKAVAIASLASWLRGFHLLSCVTADPAEGEGWTEPGQESVEAVPMPAALRETIAGFVAAYHVERPFQKRVRDRANPDALARRRSNRSRQ